MSIATFNELRDAILDYAHTPHLTTQVEGFFIELATLRIGRDLKSLANEITLPFADQQPPLTLPLDFGQIRNVTHIGPRGPRVLESRSANTLWPLQRSGFTNTPVSYNIRNGSVVVAPLAAERRSQSSEKSLRARGRIVQPPRTAAPRCPTEKQTHTFPSG